MIIKQFTNELKKAVFELFNEVASERKFYKELSEAEFNDRLFNNSEFTEEGAFVALDGDKLVGFISGLIKKSDMENPEMPGYINTIMVKEGYRRQGLASKLVDLVEEYFKSKGRKYSRLVFLSPVNWQWHVPTKYPHEHPGTPAVPINSPEYFFYLSKGYVLNGIHEGFHLDLEKYTLPESMVKRMEENAKKGLYVEIYDPKKHYGIEEFCEAINNPGFKSAILYNLKREKPFPFLVAHENGRVVGWTGAMYNEESDRGHFDGIAVDPGTRSGGLGKALFCYLCEYSKNNGSKYMTFFTGLTNPARFIYLFAGFKIVTSFADLKKELK